MSTPESSVDWLALVRRKHTSELLRDAATYKPNSYQRLAHDFEIQRRRDRATSTRFWLALAVADMNSSPPAPTQPNPATASPAPRPTWDDIDRCLALGAIETQPYETLLAFSRVTPPASSNPAFNARAQHAHERIRERLRQMELQQSRDQRPQQKWHEHPAGKLALMVLGGLLLLVLSRLLSHSCTFFHP